MRHYRRNPSGNDRVKRIMFRILFVLIAAAVITFGAILIGNLLQKKLLMLDAASAEEENRTNSTALLSPEAAGNTLYRSENVFGASILLRDYSSEDEAVLAVNTMAPHYDTVLLDITNENGQLLYTSPALCEANRMPPPADNTAFRLFGSAAAAVKAQDRNLCVILTPNLTAETEETAAWSDGTLIGELVLYGVDEILLVFSQNTSLTDTLSKSICDYITECRRISGNICPIGVLLHTEHYLSDANTQYIQMIADTASFLGIHFPAAEDEAVGSSYRYVKNSITSLLASFNVYNMRVILEGVPKVLAAKYEGCKRSGITNICFASYILPDNLSYTDSPEETETEPERETIDPASQTNPYITTRPTETQAPAETDPPSVEPVPEEIDQSGESGIRWY